jgi:hypothetical protein
VWLSVSASSDAQVWRAGGSSTPSGNGAGATATQSGASSGASGRATKPGPSSMAARFAHLPVAVQPVNDPVNVQRLQAKASTKGCGISEVAPGVFVRIDCQGYSRITKSVLHLGAAKSRLLAQGKLSTRGMAARAVIKPTNGSVFRAPKGGAPTPTPDPTPPPVDPNSIKGGGVSNDGSGGVSEGFPDAVDHRALGLSGPIKNQGSVGACTAFALSTAIDNGLRRAGREETISPTHVWAAYGMPNMQDAGDYNLGRLVATYDTWPYSSKEACRLSRHPNEECDQYVGVPKNSWKNDSKLMASFNKADSSGVTKISNIEELTPKPKSTDEIVQVLASGADIWAAFLISSSAWSNRSMKNAVIPDWQSANGGHAVTISGYRQTPRGREFMIHNSWGETWGDKGYAWISEAMVKKFLMFGYRIKLEGQNAAPAELTDDDCPWDELVDSVTGQCAKICPDDSRPADGKCAFGSKKP